MAIILIERSILEGIFAIILTNACKAKEMIVFTIENCWSSK
jgi:hypothetical protein